VLIGVYLCKLMVHLHFNYSKISTGVPERLKAERSVLLNEVLLVNSKGNKKEIDMELYS